MSKALKLLRNVAIIAIVVLFYWPRLDNHNEFYDLVMEDAGFVAEHMRMAIKHARLNEHSLVSQCDLTSRDERLQSFDCVYAGAPIPAYLHIDKEALTMLNKQHYSSRSKYRYSHGFLSPKPYADFHRFIHCSHVVEGDAQKMDCYLRKDSW